MEALSIREVLRRAKVAESRELLGHPQASLLKRHLTAIDRGESGIMPAGALMTAAEHYVAFLGEVAPSWKSVEEPLFRQDLGLADRLDRSGRIFDRPALLTIYLEHSRLAWHALESWALWWIAGARPDVQRFGLYLGGRHYRLHQFEDHAADERAFTDALWRARFTEDEEPGAPSQIGDDDGTHNEEAGDPFA